MIQLQIMQKIIPRVVRLVTIEINLGNARKNGRCSLISRIFTFSKSDVVLFSPALSFFLEHCAEPPSELVSLFEMFCIILNCCGLERIGQLNQREVIIFFNLCGTCLYTDFFRPRLLLESSCLVTKQS